MLLRSILITVPLWTLSVAACAAVLEVGTGQQYTTPGQAVAAARDGDTVRIHPGEYFDCAIVRQNNLTIEGVGKGVVLTDRPCERKALIVIHGNNATVRNLTLQGARVPDENGAGIRAEGGNLVIENVQFINDQDGILTGDNPSAAIRIANSSFVKDGFCGHDCAHAVYVGRVKQLDVENSRFSDIYEGHDVKSRALVTRVLLSRITIWRRVEDRGTTAPSLSERKALPSQRARLLYSGTCSRTIPDLR
jgi:hypothetical protein